MGIRGFITRLSNRTNNINNTTCDVNLKTPNGEGGTFRSALLLLGQARCVIFKKHKWIKKETN